MHGFSNRGHRIEVTTVGMAMSSTKVQKLKWKSWFEAGEPLPAGREGA